jgi:hypothetical protein
LWPRRAKLRSHARDGRIIARAPDANPRATGRHSTFPQTDFHRKIPIGHLSLRRAARRATSVSILRRFRLVYWITATAAVALAALPLALLHMEFGALASSYYKLYPALFMSFVPTGIACFFMVRPIEAIVLAFPRSRQIRLLSLCALLAIPAAAVVFEWRKEWVAPWEITPRDGFSNLEDRNQLEAFKVPAETKRYFGRAVWSREAAWPAAFFFLKDTYSLLRDPGGTQAFLPQKLREELISTHQWLRRTHSDILANDRLISGELRMSRTGAAHYLTVASISFLATSFLLAIAVLAFVVRQQKEAKLHGTLFLDCLAGLFCFASWALMRQSTAMIDEAVFIEPPAIDQLGPLVLISMAAAGLTFVGIGEKTRANVLGWFALLALFVGSWVAHFTRDKVAAIFGDLRSYLMLAVSIFILLVASLIADRIRPKDSGPLITEP